MLASELRVLVLKLCRIEMSISDDLSNELRNDISQLNSLGQLRNELVLLVVPRNPTLKSEISYNFTKQASAVDAALHKICYPTILKAEGWKRLPSIVAIMNKLGWVKNTYKTKQH